MNSIDLDKENIKLLQQLDETSLKLNIVKPLFEMKGWKVVDVHGDAEEDHKCDLTLRSESHWGEEIFIGVQIKASTGGEHDIRNSTDAEEIRARADKALRYPISSESDGSRRFAKFIWITAGSFKERGKAAIRKSFSRFELLDGRVEVWDCDVLYRRLQEAERLHRAPNWPPSETLERLQINILRDQILSYRTAQEGVFAVVAAYRVLRKALKLSPPDLGLVLTTLDAALSALQEDPYRSTYYHRVLWAVLDSWKKLLGRKHTVFANSIDNLALRMADADFSSACGEAFGESAEFIRLFLRDFEAIFRQLEQLEKHYVQGPAGLSTLQICRLLLRVGFPRNSPSIASRLNRTRAEFNREDGQSIDGACSLCTGTGLSCLALSRIDIDFQACIDWLSSLRARRFCYQGRDYGRDRKAWEHALHYAASVLLGLIDLEAIPGKHDLLSLVNEVVAVFFPADHSESVLFLDEWMRHRNVDRFEVYRYIFSSFLAFTLRHGTSSAERADFMTNAIKTMILEIQDDCGHLASPWLVYATRTNLDAFSLGLVLEVPEAIAMARQVTRRFRYRAGRVSKDLSDPLWDSNVDRTALFLESYLNYWETLFYLRERGRKVSEFLPDLEPPTGLKSEPQPPETLDLLGSA